MSVNFYMVLYVTNIGTMSVSSNATERSDDMTERACLYRPLQPMRACPDCPDGIWTNQRLS